MRIPSRRLASLVLALGIAAGCGGGGGGGAYGTVSFTSHPLADGYVSSDGTSSCSQLPFVGSAGGVFSRGLFGFNLPMELAGKTIVDATLRLDQFVAAAGAFAAYGNLVVDHVDLDGWVCFDGTLFTGSSLVNSFGTLSTDASLGVKTLDVTARVQADVAAGRMRTSYRLHFESEGLPLDQGAAYFGDADMSNPTPQPPELVVTYR